MPSRPALRGRISPAPSCESGRSRRVSSARTTGALVTPQLGGTSRSGRLAPCRSTSKLVSRWVGRNRTRLVQHHRSRATPVLPPRQGGNPSLSRQIAFSARVHVGAFPSAIGWCARPAPATYSIHFSKTTAHASSRSGPRFPTGSGDSRLLRWDIHFGGPSPRVPGLFDLVRAGGPYLCPCVADPVIEPVSEPTRVTSLDRSTSDFA
jgi:hypothetical protein